MTKSLCVHCGTTLHQQPCTCWVDTRWTRWCPGTRQLHQPDGGTQPERCPSLPKPDRGTS